MVDVYLCIEIQRYYRLRWVTVLTQILKCDLLQMQIVKNVKRIHIGGQDGRSLPRRRRLRQYNRFFSQSASFSASLLILPRLPSVSAAAPEMTYGLSAGALSGELFRDEFWF